MRQQVAQGLRSGASAGALGARRYELSDHQLVGAGLGHELAQPGTHLGLVAGHCAGHDLVEHGALSAAAMRADSLGECPHYSGWGCTVKPARR